MKKKIVLMLAATMIVGLLSSCGKKKVETSSNDEPKGTTQSDSSKKDSDQGTEKKESKEKIKIKIASRTNDNNTLYADNTFVKKLADEAGIEIEWTEWPASQIKEKRNLAFASGVLPDAFYGPWVIETADIPKYGAEGILADLKPYITPEKMPNFTKVLEHTPQIEGAMSTPEGKVYGLLQYIEPKFQQTNDTLIINTEWLKKVGKEMPTTIDEFYEVLRAFKDAGDLNGNGKNDEIPFTFEASSGNAGYYSFVGFTGLVPDNQHTRMDKVDGKLVFVPETDQYKEFLTYMNKLYSEGLIDPECFTMDDATYNAKVQQDIPVAGVISTWNAERINNALGDNDITKDGVYQYVAPLKGNNGVEPVWNNRIIPFYRCPSFSINSKTSQEKIDALIKFIDLHYEKYTSFEGINGVEGVHFEWVNKDKGEYRILKKPDGKYYTAVEKSKDAIPEGPAVIFADQFVNVEPIPTVQGKEKAGEVYGPYVNKDYPLQAIATEDESKRSTLIMADMKTQVDMWTAKFITEGKIDEQWDEYIKGLKDIGIDEFVDIYTAIDKRASGQ